jgi:hypothetical protein
LGLHLGPSTKINESKAYEYSNENILDMLGLKMFFTMDNKFVCNGSTTQQILEGLIDLDQNFEL